VRRRGLEALPRGTVPPGALEIAVAVKGQSPPCYTWPTARLRIPHLPPKQREENFDLSSSDEESSEFAFRGRSRSRGRSSRRSRREKPVPRWCDNYLQDLTKQQSLDPDSIFGPDVPPCELEAVFPEALWRAAGAEAAEGLVGELDERRPRQAGSP